MRRGRFESKLQSDAAELNASVGFDVRLLPYDIAGSQAHARMLAAQGVIAQADADAICRGLDQVLEEWRRGELVLDPQLEDVHMNVEKRLTEIIGEAGARLHTARSPSAWRTTCWPTARCWAATGAGSRMRIGA